MWSSLFVWAKHCVFEDYTIPIGTPENPDEQSLNFVNLKYYVTDRDSKEVLPRVKSGKCNKQVK